MTAACSVQILWLPHLVETPMDSQRTVPPITTDLAQEVSRSRNVKMTSDDHVWIM